MKDTSDARGAVPGFLTTAVNQLRSSGTADVLRNEVIELPDMQVGLIVAQVTDKHQPVLLQEVFMQVSPRLYYSLALTSPCPAKDIGNDPAVLAAGQTFKAIIDSIERVDLSALRDDQDERLLRTRGLFVNWSQKHLIDALQPERYLLFKQHGRPVGYAYIVEQPADAIPKAGEVAKGAIANPNTAAGFRIGMRTRLSVDSTEPNQPAKTLDSQNWMFVSFDRRHEVWSNVTVINDPSGKTEKDKSTWFSEVGASDQQRERVFNSNLKPEDFKDMDRNSRTDKNAARPYQEVDKYKLTVRTEGRSAIAEPIQRDLPPFYIPQAAAMLLPRIVPLNNPTGYLFASYSADNRQVMLRYVDVKPETDIKLNGSEYRAVPVVDRMGLHGSPTTHYMTADGKYLGSVNDGTKMQIDPTDRATIEATFKDANLTQPTGVQKPVDATPMQVGP